VRLLLDTSVALWSLLGSTRVPDAVRDAIRDPANEVYVSAVSGWEIAIKLSLGKLAVPANLHVWLPERLAQDGYAILDVRLRHVLMVENLPQHHGDPFDRLLIAQAQVEGLTIVTGDAMFQRYGVATLRC
jgi:PIN domain nuclease of toxin-antitoxin system